MNIGKYRKFYLTLSLKELRKRQDITRSQIKKVWYDLHTNSSMQWQIGGLIRLQRIYDLLSWTIKEKFCND
jgi:hypothetical protein